MTTQAFDPKPYFLRFKGKDYLPVAARLAWLRDEHPEAHITTDLLQHEQGKYALFRATVTIPNGGSATGWGSETVEDFGDYLEKSETKALGRAVAALGYGTLHALELDEGGSVADAPVEAKAKRDVDPAVEAARATLTTAMKEYNWTPKQVLAAASSVWPHVLNKEALGTLTQYQLGRLTDVVVGTAVINNAGKIVPAPPPSDAGELAAAMR